MKLSDQLKEFHNRLNDEVAPNISDERMREDLCTLTEKVIALTEATEALLLYVESVHNEISHGLVKRADDLRERFERESG